MKNLEIEAGRASYVCGKSSIAVGSLAESRLIVMGPVIPLVPFKHNYPGYVTITASQLSTCPVIELENAEIEAYEEHQGKSSLSCNYKLGALDGRDNVVLELKHEACKPTPVRFVPKQSWDYCLVCSA